MSIKGIWQRETQDYKLVCHSCKTIEYGEWKTPAQIINAAGIHHRFWHGRRYYL